MPVVTTYPGVYVQEIPSSLHTIVGVATANTAFVDFFAQGPMGVATQIFSWGDFQTQFGGLDQRSEASYGLWQYYLNGGQVAWVVRVAGGSPAPAQVTLDSTSPPQATLTITAANPGLWGENLQYGVDYNTKPAGSELFNLVIRQVDSITKPTKVLTSEIYRNLSMDKTSSYYAVSVVNAASALVQLTDLGLGAIPSATGPDVILPIAIPTSSSYEQVADPAHPANDGTAPDATALENGIEALDRIDPYIFNILCLPAAANLNTGGTPDAVGIAGVYSYAANFCDQKRAMLLVDIPPGINSQSSTTPSGIVTWVNTLEANGLVPDANSAIYFPRLVIPDALNAQRPRNVAASGTVACIYATTDVSRGVWKSPAGIDAGIAGASLAFNMNDADNGALNPLGINALRNFKIYGNVCWGARTMQGADQLGSQWKYVAIRRTALYIEESLFEGLKWAVFEPNDDTLWGQLRLNVTAFMQGMFLQGAFQGTTPQQAYFVKCDSENNPQANIDLGIVTILVGFAPLYPAEFVVIQIEQMVDQTQS
jgi:phage tail sheath protein FI